jgi:hypothetical protein
MMSTWVLKDEASIQRKGKRTARAIATTRK